MVNNMFNNICNFISGSYSINISKDNVYIVNYDKVIDVNSDNILIMIDNKIIKINGSDLLINRLEKHELLIKGNIKGIDMGD